MPGRRPMGLPVGVEVSATLGVIFGAMVLSRDAAIPRLRRALVAPCTTTVRRLPSEVALSPAGDPIPLESSVNLDAVESVSISMLVERLGRLGHDRMLEVCAALEVAVDCGR